MKHPTTDRLATQQRLRFGRESPEWIDRRPVSTDHQKVQTEVQILNRQGLHARPVMQFVDTANRFQASISVARDDRVVDGKSPMEMMLLEATRGTRLKLTASGDDAQQLIEALVRLVESRFDEE
jgi:phosphocarrier protein HPr